MNSKKEDLKKLAAMIKDIKFTMLTTLAKDGSIYSRPMETLRIDESKFDGNLWFFTNKDSPKVHSIEDNQHVNLSYVNADNDQYISVSGRATITDNKEKMQECWNPSLERWFPEGLNDPQISLIQVMVDSTEIWETKLQKDDKNNMRQKKTSERFDFNQMQ